MAEAEVGWPFFWLWTFAHVIGFVVVKVLADSPPLRAGGAARRLLVQGGVVGCCIGVAEGLVLQRYVSWAGWWGLATVAGYTAGFPVGELVQGDLGDRPPRAGVVKKRVAGQAMFGAVVGACQALVMARHQPGAAALWILTSCVVLAGADTALKGAIRRGLPVRAAVLVLGALIGAGTGLTLTALLS